MPAKADVYYLHRLEVELKLEPEFVLEFQIRVGQRLYEELPYGVDSVFAFVAPDD